MPHTFHPQGKKQNAPLFHELWQPVENIFIGMPPLEARGNRPLHMDFEHQLKALVFYHLEEHASGRHFCKFSKKMISLAK